MYLKDKKSAMPIDNKVFKTIFKRKNVVNFIKSIQLKKINELSNELNIVNAEVIDEGYLRMKKENNISIRLD